MIDDRTLVARNRALGLPPPAGVQTGGRQKWPEEKLYIGLDSLRNFNVRAKTVGPGVSHHFFDEDRPRLGIDVSLITIAFSGYVCQVHPGGDWGASTDQGVGIRVHGAGYWTRIGGTNAYQRCVSLA